MVRECCQLLTDIVVKPFNVSKSMSSCNAPNRNYHIIKSISHHAKPLSVGRSDCSYNVSKPVICKSSNISVVKLLIIVKYLTLFVNL